MHHIEILGFAKTRKEDTHLFELASKLNSLETIVPVSFANRPFPVANFVTEHEVNIECLMYQSSVGLNDVRYV